MKANGALLTEMRGMGQRGEEVIGERIRGEATRHIQQYMCKKES